jgi:hypothetical protein
MKFSEISFDPIIYKIIETHYEDISELYKFLNENIISEDLKGYDVEISELLDRYNNSVSIGNIYTPALIVFNIGQNIIEVQYLENAELKKISSFDNSYIFEKNNKLEKFPKDLNNKWIISRTLIFDSIPDFKQFGSVLKLTFSETKFIYKEYS